MKLTCRCDDMSSSASLHLKVAYYLYNSGSEIRMIYIQHCNELYVKLDFTGVDATNLPIFFRSLQKVYIEAIKFEPTYSDRQELQLNFYNVQVLELNNLMVKDTFKLHAENVKEVRIVNSTFEHIPIKGVYVSQAKLLEIQHSKFMRISRHSIVIEKTRQVS
jgi:hypothetical protein